MDAIVVIGLLIVGLLAFGGGVLVGTRRRAAADATETTGVGKPDPEELVWGSGDERVQRSGPGNDTTGLHVGREALAAHAHDNELASGDTEADSSSASDMALGGPYTGWTSRQESTHSVATGTGLSRLGLISEEPLIHRLNADSADDALICVASSAEVRENGSTEVVDQSSRDDGPLGSEELSDEPLLFISPTVVNVEPPECETAPDLVLEPVNLDHLSENAPEQISDLSNLDVAPWPDWFLPDLPLVAELGPGRRFLPNWAIAGAPRGVVIGEYASAPRGALLILDKTPFGERITLMHPPVDPRGGRSPYDICAGKGASRYWADQDREAEVDDDTYVIVLEREVDEEYRSDLFWRYDDPVDYEDDEYDVQ